MKNKIFKTISIIAVIFCASCADLDLPSDGRLTMKEIFNNYQRTLNYFNNCRANMPQVGFTYQSSNTPLASFCDEAHDASDGVNGAVSDWYNNRTSPFSNPLTSGYMNPWDYYFQTIRKCNTFLTSIADPELSTAKIDEVEKNGWIAEIHVLRAFSYLQLIKRYGSVPLIDAPYEVTHDFSKDVRASFEACADFIIADCDAALATPESEGRPIGFRWAISDMDKGQLTRAFAYAVKSQTALFAASPLWHVSGSKYDWAKAAEITKEALDQCLLHGYELYNVPVAEDVAQNPYAYYFIQRSDASRSRDKETIYESTSRRTNVWRDAGTPVTEGMAKAGAGPSQELIDSYEMQATGEIPVTGYSDADHLNPILNPASGYDPNNPYTGRDPRFYASVYYNNSPRSLTSGKIDKEIIPLEIRFDGTPGPANQTTMTQEDGYVKLISIGGDPFVYTTTLGKTIGTGSSSLITFEYKSNIAGGGCDFFFCVAGGPAGGVQGGFTFPAASEWTRFEFNLNTAINNWGFGVNNSGGQAPENHFLRLDYHSGAGMELCIRNLQIEAFTPPPPPTPVETFVGGNCGISDRVTDIRFTRTGYYLRKFNNYRSGPTVDEDGAMKIFRLGELYLNFAEAAYQASGPDAPVASKVGGAPLSAREAVNTVRARAEMPPLAAGLSKDDFEKRYRNERRVELAFEEHRFFDVRRWKILNETDKFVTGMRITKAGDDYTYTRVKLAERGTNSDKYLMYPIMQSEVAKMEDATGNLWQNSGWE